MPYNSAVRVAFVGAGYMASEHIRAFATCPGVKLLGIHSRNSDRAEELAKQHPGLAVFPSIEALHTHTEADLVVIAVPEMACEAVCQEAFRYPWTLLVEKPVGYTLEQARRIEQNAKCLNAKVYVALNRRFYASTLQLQNALKDISGQRVVTILDQEDAESALGAGQPSEVVHNWMYANSIHLIDYFAQLCRGEIISTRVLSPWNPSAPGPVVAQLQFSSGDMGLYQAIWNAPGPWSVAVSTASLRAELRPIEQLSLQKVGSRHPEIQTADPLDLQFKPGLVRQAKAAIEAARGNASTLPSLNEANRSMKIVSSIYKMR